MVVYFKKTEACKLVLRKLEEGTMTNEETKTALHILVNLSSHEGLVNHFLDINATVRLARLFLAKVDKEIKIAPVSDDNMFSLDLELGLLGESLSIKKEGESNISFQVAKGKYSIFIQKT